MTVAIVSLSALVLGGGIAATAAITNLADRNDDSRVIALSDSRNNDRSDDTRAESAAPQTSSTPIPLVSDIDIDNDGNASLNEETITAIASAALAAAGGAGTVTDIENELGRGKPYAYEVEVERDDRTEVTIYLTDTFDVLKVVEDDLWD